MDDKYIDAWTVCGQYGPGSIDGRSVCGYRQEEGVAGNSNSPTYFAAKFHIDNWRWAGVPFYVRVGKRMSKAFTEISIHFKQPPLKLLGGRRGDIGANQLVLNIQPNEQVCIKLNAKYPGAGNRPYGVDMDFDYERSFGLKRHPAYERLINDCINGDATLFARQDGVEAMWSVVDPIIRRGEERPAGDFPNYPAGSQGPLAARQLIEKDGRCWRNV